jgi:uncharacterized protein YcbX
MPALVSSLTVYPVKSCGGVSVAAATLTDTGLLFDRVWMLVAPGGNDVSEKITENMFVSQRTEPTLALVSERPRPQAVATMEAATLAGPFTALRT